MRPGRCCPIGSWRGLPGSGSWIGMRPRIGSRSRIGPRLPVSLRAMSDPRVAVVGLGLIGGSVLRRLPGAVGYDADVTTRESAAAARFAVADTVADAVAGAEVVVLAVPLPAVASVLGDVPSSAIVTDVTSVKAPVRALAGSARFVGGHPMAGTERSGFAASDPVLFEGVAWVLCIEEDTDLEAWLTVAQLVLSTGARVVPSTADAHDEAVAKISHLPHVLAAALVATAADDPLALRLAAGSFRDGSRVAATRPELTAAMCSGNADALDAVLGSAVEQIAQLQSKLRDPAALQGLFGSAQSARLAWESPRRRASVEIDLDAADVRQRLRAVAAVRSIVGRRAVCDVTE